MIIYNKQLLLRITEQQNQAIDNLLNEYDRTTFPSKSELIRHLLNLGLEATYNKMENK